jgi:hypothetical protein
MLDRPAGATYLTGPYSGSGLGSAPMPGESVTATLNDLGRVFSTSFTVRDVASGAIQIDAFGNDGFVYLTLPAGGPGSYLCPSAGVIYGNLKSGWEGNAFASSPNCCRVEITKLGAVGDTIEGSFSGILNSGFQTWLEIEAGTFKVVRR